MPERYLTAEEFAEAVDWHRATVYRKLQSKELHSVKVGKSRRIPPSEVLRVKAERQRTDAEIAADEAEYTETPHMIGAYLSISSKTVRRLMIDGAIPHKVVAGVRRARRRDVEAYLDQVAS
jgi:excisionase family DNA binding protein